ncbi:hypothetical protein LTR56_004132 [Elasticomyces elasticus]|nr:hypothetical protein LTR22_015337 [Elasticomyces elasticus]KAK3654079.1 hypothetical protein LTR56_004132 [Elasticomyces elasticus]KAK4914657.1 hypothetical protein LTR49_017098 [Elasticomyces elasticus]KAK5753031.1 hypothetical protein LTS12_016908 [Elasticomyces elasticus]
MRPDQVKRIDNLQDLETPEKQSAGNACGCPQYVILEWCIITIVIVAWQQIIRVERKYIRIHTANVYVSGLNHGRIDYKPYHDTVQNINKKYKTMARNSGGFYQEVNDINGLLVQPNSTTAKAKIYSMDDSSSDADEGQAAYNLDIFGI